MKAKRVLMCGMFVWAIATSLRVFAQEGTPQNNSGKPDVRITVHKKTDKDGNIVSYDSTYSYSYSGNGADSALMNGMLNNWGGMNIHLFSQPFDSIPGFMNKPFFNQFDMGNMDMEKMQKMMEQQMRELMQNNNWPLEQNIYTPSLPPVKPTPEPKHSPKHPSKKVTPKQNIPDGGVQI